MGTENLLNAMKKFNIPLSAHFQKNLGQAQKIPLSDFVDNSNKDQANPDALDLLEKMLDYDK